VARFAVTGQELPHLTETIILAERVHSALVSLSDGSTVFSGCDEQGKPLDGHGHAHIFCESDEGKITHITIYASMGFSSEDMQALENLREIWGGKDPAVRLLLQGLGSRENFCGPDPERVWCPLLAKSRTWVSRTPFLPTRHPKVTRAGVPKCDARGLQIGCPEHDLLRLLEMAGFPAPVVLEPVAGTILGGRMVPWASFACRRSGDEGRQAAGAARGFRMEFAEEVQGPMAVGYASHFGMGGFEGEKNKVL
jgi:CRISPR-associated protein Csb2